MSVFSKPGGSHEDPGKGGRQGVDAVGRFGPVLSANPALIGSFRPEVTGFSMTDLLGSEVRRGHRAVLRPLHPDDFADWRTLHDAKAVQLGSVGDVPVDRASFELRCQALEFASLLGSAATFVVVVDGELVGEIEVAMVTAAGMSSGFVSLWLLDERQHLGVATEACILLMQYVFETRGLHRVECAVLPEHTSVRRSLELAHFRDEGVASGYAPANGGWHDHVRYAMTAPEWHEHREQLRAVAVEGQPLDR
jgi:ribosomal-protein-alanine N-acetyltransferase